WVIGQSGGDVLKCAVGGCNDSPTTVAMTTRGTTPAGIAVDSMNVYWTDQATNGTVWSCPLSSCSAASVHAFAMAQSAPYAITTDGTSVFWTNVGNGMIARCQGGGAGCGPSPGVVASGQTAPMSIATDGINIYWANQTASGTIMKCAGTGC